MRLPRVPSQQYPDRTSGAASQVSGSRNVRLSGSGTGYPANDDAGMPTAPGRQTNVAPACGSLFS